MTPEPILKLNKIFKKKTINILLLLGDSTGFSSSGFPIPLPFTFCVDSVPVVCTVHFVVIDLVTNYVSLTEIPKIRQECKRNRLEKTALGISGMLDYRKQ